MLVKGGSEGMLFWVPLSNLLYRYSLQIIFYQNSDLTDMNWSWWRHAMQTFSTLLAICVENSPVMGEFPAQRPVTRSSDVFFDLRLNKQLSKQWWGWWFETPSRPLWRHCNVIRKPDNSHNVRNNVYMMCHFKWNYTLFIYESTNRHM